MMSSFEKSGSCVLPPALHARIRAFVSGFLAPDAEIVAALKRVKEENDEYVVCPHTAVAAAAFYARDGMTTTTSTTTTAKKSSIVVATASPAKFPEALLAAGLAPVSHPTIEAVMIKKTKFVDLEVGQDWLKILKEKIQEITQKHAG